MSSVSESLSSADLAAWASVPLMMDSEPLTLTLTPVIASQLVQMFGPTGTSCKPFQLINVK